MKGSEMAAKELKITALTTHGKENEQNKKKLLANECKWTQKDKKE